MNHRRWPRRHRSIVAVGVAASLALAACGSDGDAADGAPLQGSTAHTGSGDQAAAPLAVVASFYPLQFVVEQVGGERVAVTNLTPAGAEPHDLELTPQDAATLQDADLVVYLANFTPTVDDAAHSLGGKAFDVTPSARLDLEAEAGDDHADDHADEGGVDPHFWLDPIRLADVADAVAARLSDLDSAHAAEFTANAAALRDELEAVDGAFETVLASCANTNIVTSHISFGYMAKRYGLTQVGISGLSPEEEPSPAKLAEVSEFVRDNDVSTIYYETLVDPSIAETVADETGAATAVLDPIEGLSDESAGRDYVEVMRANLEILRAGQDCT